MKNVRFFSVIVIFLLVLNPQKGYAGSPVWKVVKGDHHLFIGGTCHVLTESDYPLPSKFEEAYRQAAILVFETDIQKMKTPEFQTKLMQKVMYSDARTLKTVLNKKTYQALQQHFSQRGVPIASMLKFKPGMVALTLTTLELQRLGLYGTGVDEFFSLKALKDQKVIQQLETIEDQLGFLSKLGDGQENEIIAYTLNDIQKLPNIIQSIKDAWREWDRRKLEKVAITSMKKDFPDVYDELIVNRNQRWISRIETMLKTKDVEFILVGAAHLVGEDSVLTLLASRGCQIKKP